LLLANRGRALGIELVDGVAGLEPDGRSRLSQLRLGLGDLEEKLRLVEVGKRLAGAHEVAQINVHFGNAPGDLRPDDGDLVGHQVTLAADDRGP
jgi:hypothetical protein